jgi:hypothetical protein
MTFSEACRNICGLAQDLRVPAARELAAALQQGVALADPNAPAVFDPLECLAADASRCAYFGRPLLHEQRICVVALDPDVSCPQTAT